ncbi:MAG: copper-translocating P-type ATPase [Rubellimicrobium sp.]|nr:copper-translocating P-type ATPase [Rubellimicrobium sp.]
MGEHLSLPVGGMTCASCVARVERAVRAVPGVAAVGVNLATERAEVDLADPGARAAVVEAVRRAGYEVPVAAFALPVGGMTCASCVARVEKAARAVPGVRGAAANLATESLSITGEGDPGALAAQVAAAVTRAGYEARPLTAVRGPDPQARRAAETSALGQDTVLAAALTLPLFVIEMGGHLWPAFHHLLVARFGAFTLWLLEFGLATAVLFGPGRRFWSRGIAAFRALSPDMNSLVMTGAGAAWAFSAVATFAPGILPEGAAQVYYESAAVIVTLILFGRWLEARARGATSQAIRGLIELAPPTARVLRGEEEAEVPLALVVPGDRIRLRPGDRVPVDGLVEEGAAHVDESMLTGESLPVTKGPGDALVAGTVNGAGTVVMRAERVGADTALARIVRMVEAAQSAKLPVQEAVDRITAWFVPAVMAVAAVTVAVWLVAGGEGALTAALVHGVAVLIIACPCAMGLATPVSIMVGTGRAAQMGVLFRNGLALQSLAGVGTVAFDKTGTLTEGRAELTDFVVAPGLGREAVLRLAAAAEAGSEHPLARALVAAARAEAQAGGGGPLPAAQAFESLAGQGVRATVEGRQVAVGSARFMATEGVDIAPLAPEAALLAGAARGAVHVAIDGRLAAVLAVSDPVRPGSAAAVARLDALGVRSAMVTGDSAAVAAAVAARLGIGHVEAEVLPEGKVEAVARLRGGGTIAFAGDGINDAPALAAADVGIAMGSGTDIAIESADVVLTGGDPGGVARAIALARATLGNIRQNLFWAFAYNVALVPVAAGVLVPAWGITLSPMLAAGAMALSSVFVVSNALRLGRWQEGRA